MLNMISDLWTFEENMSSWPVPRLCTSPPNHQPDTPNAPLVFVPGLVRAKVPAGFLFVLPLALLSSWGLLQICTNTANDSLCKHSSLFSTHQTIRRNAAGMAKRVSRLESLVFFLLLIKTKTNTASPGNTLDIKNPIRRWQHWLNFDCDIDRRTLMAL